MCVGPNLRHPEQVVLTESKSLAQKGRGLANRCAGGAAEGRGKGRSHRPGLGADTFPALTSGRARGLGPGSEGAKFDVGFCGLGDAL